MAWRLKFGIVASACFPFLGVHAVRTADNMDMDMVVDPSTADGGSDLAMQLKAVYHPQHHRAGGTSNPILFFAMGPTGSGKSLQEMELLRLFNSRNNHLVENPPKMMLVDELVEGDATYRANMLAYLREKLGKTPTEADIDAWITAAETDVYNFFDKEYFGCRTEWGCGRAGGCGALFNENVRKAYAEHHNVIYESTGKEYPDRKIKSADALSGLNYTVVVGINTLEFCDLLHRLARRTSFSISQFMNDPTNAKIAAPRPINLNDLAKRVEKILKATSSMIDCIGEPITEACPAKIDELFVFDNEHMGFLPSVGLKTPQVRTEETERSLTELKAEAKAMLQFMKPHDCTPRV